MWLKKALYNALEFIFPGIRRFGCYFHYSLNLRKNLKNYDLLSYDKLNEFLTDLLLIPFKIQNNDKIIDDIFSLYKEKCLIILKNILYFNGNLL